jgi:phosphate uptake regulator
MFRSIRWRIALPYILLILAVMLGLYAYLSQFIQQMYREIKSPISIDRGNHLMWAAHNLERMADRVSNICERIVYVNTGQLCELESFDDLGEAHE